MKLIILVIYLLLYLNNFALANEIYKSTAQDRVSLEVNIYNQNMALIRDVRKIHLPLGICILYFEDVAKKINPKTVYARSLSNPKGLSVLEQHYAYDEATSKNLLHKYIGENIKIYIKDPETYQEKAVEATLLNNDVFKIGNEIYIGRPNKIILPQIPEGLFLRPTLVWLLENSQEENLIGVSYITSDINWCADYVLIIGKNQKRGELRGWATIDNKSGIDYNNAQIKLISMEEYQKNIEKYEPKMITQSEKRPLEYYVHKLDHITTIKDNQKKQINFFDKDINIAEKLVCCGDSSYFRSYYGMPISHENIEAYLEIENDFGIALPNGKVDIYREDKNGGLRFIGKDDIKYTPEGEKIILNLGPAFDVMISRRQTVYRRLTTSLYEIGWEISLENHREKPIEVIIKEPIEGDWEVISTSLPYRRINVHTLQFAINVPANDKNEFGYQVRVRYE